MAVTNAGTNTVTRDRSGRKVVAAVFHNRPQAERAIDALRAAGFTGQQVGVAMRDRTESGELIKDTGTSAIEGAVSGAVGGGLLGGAAGFLVGLVTALVIPGVGPVVAAGALASALATAGSTAIAGAGIGAAAGGLVGALTGLGFPEEEAKYFETHFQTGGVLVTVHAEGRSGEALGLLQRYGGDIGEGAGAVAPR